MNELTYANEQFRISGDFVRAGPETGKTLFVTMSSSKSHNHQQTENLRKEYTL